MKTMLMGVALAMASCGGEAKPSIQPGDARPADTHPWALADPPQLSVAADTADFAAFGVELFRQLADAAPDRNVVVSPVSAGLAVGMVAGGAEGATREGILRTLGADGADLAAVQASHAATAAALRTDSVELAVANALWLREGTRFDPAFLDRTRRFYGATTETVDFAARETPARIDAWAAEHTRGRITQIARTPMDTSLVLYVTNAVYFKGDWRSPFTASATRPEAFHAPGGDVQVPMMRRTGRIAHRAGDGFQAVRLPYRGDRIAMYVLLPDSGTSLAALRARMTAEGWEGWMGGFERRDVALRMPRYRLELTSDLRAPLAAMGMADAFDRRGADFGAMRVEADSVPRLYIGQATQKVFLLVDEEGTEAAAVTAIGVVVADSAPEPPLPFVVDRPFLLAIRDDATGALLFVGQVVDPTAGGS